MGNYEQLKQSVSDVIKTNGNQEITGSILQNVLLTIISSVGANATFAGIATPATNPGTPDGPVFYLASEGGTYSNFNAIELQDGLSVLMWNGSWSSQQMLGSNRFGYNVTVFGLVTGVHTLATAVKNVPPAERFGGQKITFKTDSGWVTYQNTSFDTSDYENVTNWVLDSGVSELGDVTITNNPDYEDLTQNEGGQLKFADKAHNVATYTGLGRKYLRKNIVNGVNILTQDMIVDENTIYHIQYDYILGENITIPANCVLEFEGGSLSNGEIYIENLILKLSGDRKFLGDGDKLVFGDDSANMFLTHDITVHMGRGGASQKLRFISIKSNREAIIKPIVYSNVIPHFEDCLIEKTADPIYFSVNSESNRLQKFVFENCKVYASQVWEEKTDTKCLIIFGGYKTGIYNCDFDNVGIAATGEILNCRFNVGYNTLYNNETIHGGGLIQNCYFYSTYNLEFDWNMQDIIDTYTAKSVKIDSCHFDETIVCANVITFKQHYGRPSDPSDGKPVADIFGLFATNCVFKQKRGQAIKIYTETNEETPNIDNIHNVRNIIIRGNAFWHGFNTVLELSAAANVDIVNNKVFVDDVNTNFNAPFIRIENSKHIRVLKNNFLYEKTIGGNTSYRSVFVNSICRHLWVEDNIFFGYSVVGINKVTGKLTIKNNHSIEAYNLWGTASVVDLTQNGVSCCVENNSYYDPQNNKTYNCDVYNPKSASNALNLMPLYVGAKRFNTYWLTQQEWYNGSQWIKYNSTNSGAAPYGDAAKVPTKAQVYDGASYFRTDIETSVRSPKGGIMTFYRGLDPYENPVWIEADGAFAGVKRHGATSERPAGNTIYIGFMYFDTDLGYPIYAKSITLNSTFDVTWVDATGATV